ncbi:hypothetical protein NKG94_24070 [Micromonospora sp. M12]
MSQPPANPYGPPHDSSDPSQQPGQPQQPGGWPPPQQQGFPQQQQPGYPAPQPGQPQPGGWPPPQQQGFPPAQPGQPYGDPNFGAGPPPAKKSNVGKIVLIALAVVLVLCVGGAAITWMVVKDDVGEVVDAGKTGWSRRPPSPVGRRSPTRNCRWPPTSWSPR